jgi:hypothetical protein
MYSKRALGFGAGLVVLLLADLAGAGLLESDPLGMPAWQGRHAYRAVMDFLAVDVEYCVYAPSTDPGNVPSPFEDRFGTDPSGGTDYVYAYQIFNDLDPDDFPDARSLIRFSVHLDDDEDPNHIGYVELPGGGGVDPNSWGFEPETAGWSFDPTLNVGQVSKVLIFTSPYGPEWDRGAVSGGGLGVSDDDSMPSPVPDPGTVVLVAVGAALALPRKGIRKSSRTL